MYKTYLQETRDSINATIADNSILLYGENINVGSCLSGLARGIDVNGKSKILNVGNCELSHIGIGLGIMADGGKSALFMKQLDFLLLGIDQLVNTFNLFRAYPPEDGLGSFTIYVIVCDQGYQGPQSSFNAVSDISSLANINSYCLNGSHDIKHVIHSRFIDSGIKLIVVSQRLFNEPTLDLQAIQYTPDLGCFKYYSGDDITIACYNFSLREGLNLAANLRLQGIDSDIFHINFVPNMDLSLLRESCMRTGKLLSIDDSKSIVKFSDMHGTNLKECGVDLLTLSCNRRGSSDDKYGVNKDIFKINKNQILSFLNIL